MFDGLGYFYRGNDFYVFAVSRGISTRAYRGSDALWQALLEAGSIERMFLALESWKERLSDSICAFEKNLIYIHSKNIIDFAVVLQFKRLADYNEFHQLYVLSCLSKPLLVALPEYPAGKNGRIVRDAEEIFDFHAELNALDEGDRRFETTTDMLA